MQTNSQCASRTAARPTSWRLAWAPFFLGASVWSLSLAPEIARGQISPYAPVAPGVSASSNATGQAPGGIGAAPFSGLNSSTGRYPSLPAAAGSLPEAHPALPELPTANSDAAPTDSGAALTGNYNATVSDTNSEIGVARRYLYKFNFGTRAVFDDNIFLNEGSLKESDEFFVLNADITLGLGDPTGAGNYFRFEYSPDASFYVQHSENDALQHSLSLNGLYQIAKVTLSGRFEMRLLDGTDINTITNAGASSTQANIDVNGRSQVNIFTGSGNVRYPFTEKTSADFTAAFTRNDYKSLISSQSYSGSLFGNYVFSPKLTTGIGATIGRTTSDPPNPDENYYQANFRATYELSGKMSAGGTVGIEVRSSDASDERGVGPIFDLNLIYLPFDGSVLSMSASRRVTPSAVQGGQNFESTDLSISLRQRFFQKYFVSLTTGYQNSQYVSQVTNLSATREDNYFYVQPGLDFAIHERVNVGVNYLHRESTSTLSTNGFIDNQVSVFVSVSF